MGPSAIERDPASRRVRPTSYQSINCAWQSFFSPVRRRRVRARVAGRFAGAPRSELLFSGPLRGRCRKPGAAVNSLDPPSEKKTLVGQSTAQPSPKLTNRRTSSPPRPTLRAVSTIVASNRPEGDGATATNENRGMPQIIFLDVKQPIIIYE